VFFFFFGVCVCVEIIENVQTPELSYQVVRANVATTNTNRISGTQSSGSAGQGDEVVDATQGEDTLLQLILDHAYDLALLCFDCFGTDWLVL